MTFFECQTELPQPFPEAADADLHIVFRQEPGLQFGKRRIGFSHNAGTKSFVIRRKIRLGSACPGTGARLSRLLPTSQNFVDIGHADPEDGRSRISARSRIHCRHHPFAQVLRVSSPHTVPPSNQRREGIKNSAPMEYASDSINSEGALVKSLAMCFPKDANWNVMPMAAPSGLLGTCVNARMNKTGDFCRSAPAMVRF